MEECVQNVAIRCFFQKMGEWEEKDKGDIIATSSLSLTVNVEIVVHVMNEGDSA